MQRLNSKRVRARGPDFLCIGMQKAGTGFLYECLQNLQGFRLPLIKELHHFDNHGSAHPRGLQFVEKVADQFKIDTIDFDSIRRGFDKKQVRWPLKEKFKMGGRRHWLDEPNLGFLRNYVDYAYGGVTDKKYIELFTPYCDFVCGELTPAYSTLDHYAIKHVHELMPTAKIILCVREPVGRLWSHLNMRIRSDIENRHDRRPESEKIEEFDYLLRAESLEVLVKQERFMSRSLASQVYPRWVEVFGAENLLVIHFKDLIGKTGLVLDKTAEFLGAKAQDKKSIPRNRKEKAMKIALDDERREILQRVLRDEIEAFQVMFDNHPDRV